MTSLKILIVKKIKKNIIKTSVFKKQFEKLKIIAQKIPNIIN